jgi:hypothetical protein
MPSKSIVVDGVTYVPEDNIKSSAPAVSVEGLPYVIARTYSAGVFAGYLKERNGQEVTLLNARRLWYWAGAASLSQLAEEGVSKPKECKFPQEVTKVELLQTIEILQVTEKARESIANVSPWKE